MVLPFCMLWEVQMAPPPSVCYQARAVIGRNRKHGYINRVLYPWVQMVYSCFGCIYYTLSSRNAWVGNMAQLVEYSLSTQEVWVSSSAPHKTGLASELNPREVKAGR